MNQKELQDNVQYLWKRYDIKRFDQPYAIKKYYCMGDISWFYKEVIEGN